jgi:hypothetical protein
VKKKSEKKFHSFGENKTQKYPKTKTKVKSEVGSTSYPIFITASIMDVFYPSGACFYLKNRGFSSIMG